MDFEEEAGRLRAENQKYLDLFEQSLQGMAPRTIRKHLSNMDLFLNDFLPGENLTPMEEGPVMVGLFVDHFLIHKFWSSPERIRSSAASLKKFYRCMADHGKIEESAWRDMCRTIRAEMPGWLNSCRLHNSTDDWL